MRRMGFNEASTSSDIVSRPTSLPVIEVVVLKWKLCSVFLILTNSPASGISSPPDVRIGINLTPVCVWGREFIVTVYLVL